MLVQISLAFGPGPWGIRVSSYLRSLILKENTTLCSTTPGSRTLLNSVVPSHNSLSSPPCWVEMEEIVLIPESQGSELMIAFTLSRKKMPYHPLHILPPHLPKPSQGGRYKTSSSFLSTPFSKCKLHMQIYGLLNP